MNFRNLVLANRSRRRFYQEHAISRETLVELVDLARLSPSGANKQPLKYVLACDPELTAKIFPLLGWAGYLKDWPGPEEGERPSAYIIMLGDKNINQNCGVDEGIAAQTIMLGAADKGLGGCMIATVKQNELRQLFPITENLQVLLVLALGKPKEEVVVEPLGEDGDIRYWRDEAQVHHVPKRSLEEILVA
jgi:nitroreductase